MSREEIEPQRFVLDRGSNRGSRRRIILGIDPGITTGLAALDLDGNFLFAKSEREVSLNRIVDEVARYGKVILVATDVTPAPDLAKKVASTLKVSMFIPSRSMEVPEKRELVGRYSQTNAIEVGDSHARDALASVIKALHKFKNKFEKLEAELIDEVPVTKERTKELLVKGFSIARAIRESEKQLTAVKRTIHPREHAEMRTDFQKKLVEKAEIIARLNDLVENLQAEIDRLIQENLELKSHIEKERARSDVEIRKDRLYKTQQNQITNLTKRFHELEEKLKLERRKTFGDKSDSTEVHAGMTRLKTIESFSSEGLEKAAACFQIEPGDAVIIKDGSGGGASTARMLVRLRPSVVVMCTAMSDQAEEVLTQYAIPVVRSSLLSITSVRGNSFVPTKDIRSEIDRQRSLTKSNVKSVVEKAIEGYRGD
jgi:predicted RNase H-like nuclease (RuvC/YqgF family)